MHLLKHSKVMTRKICSSKLFSKKIIDILNEFSFRLVFELFVKMRTMVQMAVQNS